MTTPAGFPVTDAPLIPTWPRIQLQIAWTAGGNSSSPNHWFDVSKRMRGSWKARLAGRQYELDTVQAGTMDCQLDNLDGAFDPDNASSPFYPYVLPYRRARLVMWVNPSRNLLYPWVANGTSITSMAATVGTLGTATGLPASLSGLTTAQTWSLTSGAAAGRAVGLYGATQSWANGDCAGTTVTPGAPYALGVDVSLSTGTASLQAVINWYSLTGTLISSTTGSSVSVGTGWSRLTCAGNAPAGAAFALSAVQVAVGFGGVVTIRTTGWQLEQAAAPTSWADAGTWGQLWQGFVEEWPAKYDKGGKYGIVEPTFVDGLGPLSQLKLGNVMPPLVASKSPQYRFDLAATTTSDPLGGTAFPDLGGTGAALHISGANYATNVAISSTTDQGTLWNVPGPVMSLLSNQASTLGLTSGATYLQPWASGSKVILPTSGGWTRMICFRTTNLPGSGGRFSLATLWATTAHDFTFGSGDQAAVYCYINSGGLVGVNVQTSSGASLVAINPTPVCDGNWHCAVVSLSADGKQLNVFVDSQSWGNSSGSDMHATTYDNDAIGTLLITNSSVNTQPFNGDLAWFAQWNTALSSADMLDLSQGFATGWSGEQAAVRISRALNLSGYNSGSWTSFQFIGSLGTMGSVSTAGRSPLDIMQVTADTEGGQIVIDRTGTPVLYGHVWRWVQSTPLVVFGEDTVNGEIPYEGDISFVQDPARLFNDVQITCDGTIDATDATRVQEATDATSQTAYFPQSLTRTINPQTVQAGNDIADYLLSQFKDPHTRVSTITVNLATDPTRQSALLTRGFADLVRVRKRPIAAPMKSLDCFIEQVEWTGDDTGQLKVTYSMSPASQYDYWMISAAWAALTTSPASGVSTLTVGPISGNNSIAAQYVLPTPYTMTLGYGTANVETVTVTGVQTVSPGYSTVQLTLSAPTTKSHASGDLICEPLPGNDVLPPAGPAYPKCFDSVAAIGGTTPLIGF